MKSSAERILQSDAAALGQIKMSTTPIIVERLSTSVQRCLDQAFNNDNKNDTNVGFQQDRAFDDKNGCISTDCNKLSFSYLFSNTIVQPTHITATYADLATV